MTELSNEQRIKIYRAYEAIMNYAINLSHKDLYMRKKVLFEWIKTGQISFKEFDLLCKDFVETDNYLVHFKEMLKD